MVCNMDQVCEDSAYKLGLNSEEKGVVQHCFFITKTKDKEYESIILE